jgi:hypothetical protein
MADIVPVIRSCLSELTIPDEAQGGLERFCLSLIVLRLV